MTSLPPQLPAADALPAKSSGSVGEVFAAFLKLGLTSFGGPIAHVGFFHREFVEQRRWLDGARFAQVLALCQFLPGPASSQLGFALGLLRAGWMGAIAAFLAFTLPSAVLLIVFAGLSDQLDGPIGRSAVDGLKLAAVAVVAQAVVTMARTLTPDLSRALIAVIAAGVTLMVGSAAVQVLVVAVAAAIGPWACRGVAARAGVAWVLSYGRRSGAILLVTFGVLLGVALTVAPNLSPLGQLAGAFYRAGALVFGGGHVVLPLLEHAVVDPGWISNDAFLSGYGAAQAVPGPMFSIAAFLGERVHAGQGGFVGAAIGLLAIFVPGLLLVAGALPFWHAWAQHDSVARVMAGVNAAVVGLLAAALVDPVWVSAVHDGKDFAIAVAAFVLLTAARWPAWAAVGMCALASVAFGAATGG